MSFHSKKLGLDLERFRRDLEAEETRKRVDEDLGEGKRNGVTGTPTVFVDGIPYDGAWDFYSMLEALERPIAQKVQRSARVFASLPSAGFARTRQLRPITGCLSTCPLVSVRPIGCWH